MSGRRERPARTVWRRCPFGWLSADRSVFLERGARMTDGGTAWLIWYRMDPAEVGTDSPTPYSLANGNPVRRLGELTGDDDTYGEDEGFYDHRNDAGSLSEAKLTAFTVLGRNHEEGQQ